MRNGGNTLFSPFFVRHHPYGCGGKKYGALSNWAVADEYFNGKELG